MNPLVPPVLQKPSSRGQDPDNTQEGTFYQFLEKNYHNVKVIRLSGIIKKSWCSCNRDDGYTWACVIPSNSHNSNAVVLQFTWQEGAEIKGYNLKVLLGIGPVRFRGKRGSPMGDLYFRLDAMAPFEEGNFGPKDFCPRWKHFSVTAFDLSDEQKVRRGLVSPMPDVSEEHPCPANDVVFDPIPVTVMAAVQQPPSSVQDATNISGGTISAASTPTAPPPATVPPVRVESRAEKKIRLMLENRERLRQEELAELAKRHEKQLKAEHEELMAEIRAEIKASALAEFKALHPDFKDQE